jgi:predicted ATP-grasp superfamily ATP-dependent carboligase
VGGQPIPQQGCLLPAEEAAQLAERLDQAFGVVGVDLVVEGK